MSGHKRAEFTLRDGAQLSYLTAGDAGGEPVLLIHGSTETAESDWFVHSDVGSRLASLGYFVVAPDCRGHGRSLATRASSGLPEYSFEQMAADGAELLRALGMPRAFVCGHSNGGTVALCLARSFPLQVRAAVVLAGNAYVDEHVRTRVPVGMDPDRVEQESPAWRDSMVDLHDAHQGEGYWRDLLLATIGETVSYPQWTATTSQGSMYRCWRCRGVATPSTCRDVTPRPSPSGCPGHRCGSPRATGTRCTERRRSSLSSG